jgi:GntR family transcriptional regulator
VYKRQVLPNPHAVEASLYAYLAERGLAPVRALQHIRAVNASRKHAKLLDIAPGQALLFITRIGYLDNDVTVEQTHSYCLND